MCIPRTTNWGLAQPCPGDAQCLTVLNDELHGAVSVKGRGDTLLVAFWRAYCEYLPR
jgi:hypothetical protein